MTIKSTRWHLDGLPKADFNAAWSQALTMTPSRQLLFMTRVCQQHQFLLKLNKGRSVTRTQLYACNIVCRFLPLVFFVASQQLHVSQ
jgi:hypothetical protein